MKYVIPILLLWLAASGTTQTALAQFNQGYPANPHEPNEVVPGETRPATESETRTFKMEAPKAAGEKVGNLSGQCRVQKGNGNFSQTPCMEVVLQLVPKAGDLISTRTDRDGTFEFSVDPKESYTLQTFSRLYQVVNPAGPVRAGKNLKVWLRQK